MRTVCCCLLLAALAPLLVAAANHAVLVASHYTYDFAYRFQADLARSYQILVNNGVPRENIIVMMYDDVANSSLNPFPGKLFNEPTEPAVPGVDVYKGIRIDYSGEDVTAKNFFAVITGDASSVKGGNGRVLNSTLNDEVFINFINVGALEHVIFPAPKEEINVAWGNPGGFVLVTRETFLAGINAMQTKKMYKEMVIFLDQSWAGSLFNKKGLFDRPLPANVLAVAASEVNGHSYPRYGHFVQGVDLITDLGTVFSVGWMREVEAKSGTSLTFRQLIAAAQAEIDRQRGEGVQVIQSYGSLLFGTSPLLDEDVFKFLGNKQ